MFKKNKFSLKNIFIILTLFIIFLVFWLLSNSTTPLKRLTRSEATTIAENYKNIEKKTFNSWENTIIKKVTPIYSSNGIIIAYEASIFDNKDNARGFIMINTSRNEPLIPTFTDSGVSMTNSMLEYYKTTLTEIFEKKGLKPVEFRILGRMPICFAIGVKFDKKNIEEMDFILEDGWYIFSEIPQCKNKIYHDNGKISKYQEIIGNSEMDEFRKDLLENNKESEFFIEESSGSIQ